MNRIWQGAGSGEQKGREFTSVVPIFFVKIDSRTSRGKGVRGCGGRASRSGIRTGEEPVHELC